MHTSSGKPSHSLHRRLFHRRKVLLAGFGREGRSTLKYLLRHTQPASIDIADQDPGLVALLASDAKLQAAISNLHLGKNYLQTASDYDIIVRSPGIYPRHPQLVKAGQHGVTITSHTQLFFDLYASQTIGVTGTAGKSTTSSLIHHLLTTQNLTSLLVGNIGRPALDHAGSIRPHTHIVMELSSHQLMDLTTSPHLALWLNLFPDHLDYYASMDEYSLAKANIARFQTAKDFLIIDASNRFIRQQSRLAISTIYHVGRSRPFPAVSITGRQVIFHRSINQQHRHSLPLSLPLLGVHNRTNILFALALVDTLKADLDQAISDLTTFQPLPHRLETVATIDGITYINDSIATTPQSTILALKSLPGRVGTLILGGLERHQDFSALIKHIDRCRIPNLVLFPQTGSRIGQSLKPCPNRQIFRTSSLISAVDWAHRHTPAGHICLLSPASASFNLYKDFEDRGDQFKQAVQGLGQ